MSVDQGAACVIARRALGLREQVRPLVTSAVAHVHPRSGAREHMQGLRALAKALPKRRSTWERSGLCLRLNSSGNPWASRREPRRRRRDHLGTWLATCPYRRLVCGQGSPMQRHRCRCAHRPHPPGRGFWAEQPRDTRIGRQWPMTEVTVVVVAEPDLDSVALSNGWASRPTRIPWRR